MTDDQSSLVSQLLRHWTEGDEKALIELLPLVYNELRRVARFHLHRNHEHDFSLDVVQRLHDICLVRAFEIWARLAALESNSPMLTYRESY
jgi:hypothetical protein